MTEKKPRFYQNTYTVEEDEPEVTANQEVEPSPEATLEPAPVTPDDHYHKTRYDSLKQHYDKMIVSARQREKELSDQIKKASEKFELPDNREELEQWRKDFPDLYKIVRMISRLETDERTKELDEKVNVLAQKEAVVTREKAETILVRLHPDFPELRASKEFRDWLDLQDPTIQGWLYDGDDPHLAAKAISMYKAEKILADNKKLTKPQRNADASLAITRTKTGDNSDATQPKIWKLSEIDKLNSRQFEKFEAEIDKAWAEGRVVNG